jgi:hypothetical protein
MDTINIILLFVACAAAAGFVLNKRRAPKKSMVPSRVAQKLVKIDPDSVSVDTLGPTSDGGGVDRTAVGCATLLRSNRKIYRGKKFFYMTVPDKLKSSIQGDLKDEGELIQLSFVRRGVSHSVSCRTAGKIKLTASMTTLMDTPVKVAYKLYPVGKIEKEENRSFFSISSPRRPTTAPTPHPTSHSTSSCDARTSAFRRATRR